MAGLPKQLSEKPQAAAPRADAARDTLSDMLRTIRLTGSLQFCFIASGAWETDAAPSLGRLAKSPTATMPFHIAVEGGCWLKMEGHEAVIAAGDVVAFPFGTGHQIGAGRNGRQVTPVQDLPPPPWSELPVLQYGDGSGKNRVRLLCGFLQCDALGFKPLRDAMPKLLHVRTRGVEGAEWLRATVAQIVGEVDHPCAGSHSMLERLTEILFIQLLRHCIMSAPASATGWLAALGDPALGRCLSLIHETPCRDWSVQVLAAESGVSRSALAERFETVLATSPMRYVRDWRLCLASVALSTTRKTIAAIAEEAGYGTEAAFNRAFSRSYGIPPAAWRQTARQRS